MGVDGTEATLLVFGHLLVTLREHSPSFRGCSRRGSSPYAPLPRDAYGKSATAVVAAARCSRFALSGVHWERVDAVQVFNDCCTEKLLVQKGVTRALQAVPLTSEPELQALLEAVDLSGVVDED